MTGVSHDERASPSERARRGEPVIEVHETISQPSPGLFQVVHREHELVDTRSGTVWRLRRIWSGSIEPSVEASRESIEWMREHYAELAQRRDDDEASHLRRVRAAERETIAHYLARRTLANPDDPFAAIRGGQ